MPLYSFFSDALDYTIFEVFPPFFLSYPLLFTLYIFPIFSFSLNNSLCIYIYICVMYVYSITLLFYMLIPSFQLPKTPPESALLLHMCCCVCGLDAPVRPIIHSTIGR